MAAASSANKVKTDSDDESSSYFEASLFVDTAYVAGRYAVGAQNVVVDVLKLDAASTDHDLTGQVVWPVSILLAWFVASRRFARSRVLELGAGCGLPGFVAARTARAAALTDGSDVVVDLLRASKATFHHAKATILKLTWGDRQGVLDVLGPDDDNKTAEGSASASFGRVDVVIGADVVAWPNCVEPLLQTVAALLLGRPPPGCDHDDDDDPSLWRDDDDEEEEEEEEETAVRGTEQSATSPRARRSDATRAPHRRVFYCGFVCRAASTQRLFYDTAAAYGFDVAEIPHADFIPATAAPGGDVDHDPAAAWSHLPLHLLELRLARRTPLQWTFLSDDADRFESTNVAC